MAEVFVVTGTSGEWSDTCWWVDSVHLTEAGAVSAIEHKTDVRLGRFGDRRWYAPDEYPVPDGFDWDKDELKPDFLVFTHPRRHGNAWYYSPEQGQEYDSEAWTIERMEAEP